MLPPCGLNFCRGSTELTIGFVQTGQRYRALPAETTRPEKPSNGLMHLPWGSSIDLVGETGEIRIAIAAACPADGNATTADPRRKGRNGKTEPPQP